MFDFEKAAFALKEEAAAWRHEFHQYPERSYQEERTTRRIAEILREIGYEEIEIGIPHCPHTGVRAELNPGKPGPCIALRADIDALPVQEETGLPYASRNPGVMHACGHDAHIAMLLGTAKILNEVKDELSGDVHAGDVIGSLVFRQDDNQIAQTDIIAAEDVAAPNFFQGIGVGFDRWIRSIQHQPTVAETQECYYTQALSDR